jgi:hypothetical protein
MIKKGKKKKQNREKEVHKDRMKVRNVEQNS